MGVIVELAKHIVIYGYDDASSPFLKSGTLLCKDHRPCESGTGLDNPA